jgi:hypothetical protein
MSYSKRCDERHRTSVLFLTEAGSFLSFKSRGITQYRELVTLPWRVTNRISERSVYVLSVLDSRRGIEDILLQRLIDLKL